MAFRKINESPSQNGPIVYTMTTGIAVNEGALITKAVGTADVALMVTSTNAAGTAHSAIPPIGICTGTTVAADTEIGVLPLFVGDVLIADITEIMNKTALTATGGGATTFVDSSLLAFADNSLIGSKWKVITMASGDKAPNTILTCTDNTQSNGTITFASLGSTGFASGDTAQLISVNNDYVTGMTGFTTSATADSITLDGALVSSESCINFRCIGATASGSLGGSKDGNKLILVALTGCNTIYWAT